MSILVVCLISEFGSISGKLQGRRKSLDFSSSAVPVQELIKKEDFYIFPFEKYSFLRCFVYSAATLSDRAWLFKKASAFS